MISELENLFIMLIKHNRMWRHKTTDYDKVLSLLIPTEIMNRSLESIDFVDLFILIIEYIQTIFTIVRLTCGIIVSLKFHKEFVRGGTELKDNLFSFFDILLIERFLRLMIKENNISRVGLFV